MDKSNSIIAQQIAQAASAFERRQAGRQPKSVTAEALRQEIKRITG